MDEREVIAVLVAGYDEDGLGRATVVLRDLHGKNVSMRQVDLHETPLRADEDTACFRRGKAIRDPVSREIVCYQLEKVAMPH